MADIFCDDGIILRLESFRDTLNADPPLCKLYSNDVTPDTDTDLGDLTECTFDGYDPVAMNFNAPSFGSHQGYIQSDSCTFTRDTTGAAETAYGFFVTNSAEDELLAVGRFTASPRTFQFAGDSETVEVRFEDRDAST